MVSCASDLYALPYDLEHAAIADSSLDHYFSIDIHRWRLPCKRLCKNALLWCINCAEPSVMFAPSRDAVSRSRGVSRGICSLLVPALFGRATQKSHVYQFAVVPVGLSVAVAVSPGDSPLSLTDFLELLVLFFALRFAHGLPC
jgi:hypothetical protein